jgi:CRP/FNR family cyclic AMP-dependent transcriptional regulator
MNSSDSATQFFVWDTEKTAHGPMDLPKLIAWVRAGHVNDQTWIFVSSRSAWDRAAHVPELQLLFQPRRHRLAADRELTAPASAIDGHALRRNKLLTDFTDEQLQRFACYMTVEKIAQASVVVKQGDRSDAMYLILEGELSVHLKYGGQESELASLKPGDFFGDFALFDNSPRSADVIANRNCLLWKISTTEFQQVMREAPDLAMPFLRAIGKTLTARIRAGNKRQGETAMMAKAL